jgi:hypothetical protein
VGQVIAPATLIGCATYETGAKLPEFHSFTNNGGACRRIPAAACLMDGRGMRCRPCQAGTSSYLSKKPPSSQRIELGQSYPYDAEYRQKTVRRCYCYP